MSAESLISCAYDMTTVTTKEKQTRKKIKRVILWSFRAFMF